MPRINFQQQLAALKDKLLAMAALSQQALSLVSGGVSYRGHEPLRACERDRSGDQCG